MPASYPQAYGLASAAHAAQGVPVEGAGLGGGAGDVQGILQALRSGQISPEQILMLLSLLSGAQPPQGAAVPQGGGQGASPILAAMMAGGGGGGGPVSAGPGAGGGGIPGPTAAAMLGRG